MHPAKPLLVITAGVFSSGYNDDADDASYVAAWLQ